MPSAWIAGASGLVGGLLLRRLLADPAFGTVLSIGRRALPLDHPKLTQVLVDFSSPNALRELPAAEVAFCCLGTTIKKAGSRPAFRAVDHDAVLTFARAAHTRGVRAFLHVTSLGANARSAIFYNAVKGEVEEAVARIGIGSVYAFRPSLIDGERPERRAKERIGLALARLAGPMIGKYRPTPADAIAEAMIAAAKAPRPGVHAVEAPQILAARDRRG